MTEQDQVFGGIGDSAFGSALFIDGKLTSGQTRGGRNEKHFSGLRPKSQEKLPRGKNKVPVDMSPK